MLRTFQRITLFLVGFTMTMQGVNVTLAGLPMTTTKLITLPLLVMAGLQVSQARQRRGRDRKAMWVFAFGLSYAISSIVDLVEDAPLRVLLGDLSTHAALILFYFLVVFLIRTRDDLVLLLWALVLGAALTALPAVLGTESGLVLDEEASRFSGLSGQSNILGRDMAVCLPIAAALFLSSRSWLGRGILAGAAFLMAAGVLLSLSRTAFVSALAMGGLWLVRSGRLDTLKYAIPVVALGLGVVLFAPHNVRERWSTIVDAQKRARDESIQSRYSQTTFALKAFMSNPVVGVGIQNYTFWAQKQAGGQAQLNVIHSGYLGVLATQGLLGLIPYLMVLGFTWADYSRARRTPRDPALRRDPALVELRHLATFLQIAFFGTLVFATAHPATKSKTSWLLYALSAVVVRQVQERAAELGGAASRADEDPYGIASPLGLPPRPAGALPR